MYAYREKSNGYTILINSSPFSILCPRHPVTSLHNYRYSQYFYPHRDTLWISIYTKPCLSISSSTYLSILGFHKMVAYYTHFLLHLDIIICLYTIFPYQHTHRDASLPLRIVNNFIEWIYPNILAYLILKEI